MIRILLKPLQLLYVLYAFVVFVALMIPVFIWSLCVLPLGRIKSGNLVYAACIVWADVWCFLIFIRHKNIYEQPLEKDQSYIFVANHISYLDAALIPKIFRKPIRPLAKVELAKVPVFGFIYKNAVVTVDRSSAGNRTKSVQVLKSILRKGISVLVFPEGTFNTTHKPLKEFYDGAFRIAIETKTAIKPVLLLNTYNRLHYKSIFSLTPGKSKAVFLKEINVDGYSINNVFKLKEEVYEVMEAKLREYKASWIEEEGGTTQTSP